MLSLSPAGALLALVMAATLEVVGDAVIRSGMRGGAPPAVALGFVVLGSYGVVVNVLDIDFSKLLGAYVGVFAAASILIGRCWFGDRIPISTWIGLGVVLLGSSIIHFGSRSSGS